MLTNCVDLAAVPESLSVCSDVIVPKLTRVCHAMLLCCALGLVDYQLYTDDLAKLMGVMPDLRSVFYTYDAHTS